MFCLLCVCLGGVLVGVALFLVAFLLHFSCCQGADWRESRCGQIQATPFAWKVIWRGMKSMFACYYNVYMVNAIAIHHRAMPKHLTLELKKNTHKRKCRWICVVVFGIFFDSGSLCFVCVYRQHFSVFSRAHSIQARVLFRVYFSACFGSFSNNLPCRVCLFDDDS